MNTLIQKFRKWIYKVLLGIFIFALISAFTIGGSRFILNFIEKFIASMN